MGLLTAYNILTDERVLPYVDLLTCYSLGSAAVGMAFGFVVFRSEYYALPTFMLNTALTVCGAYLGIAYNISASAKLFFCFLSPSIGITMVSQIVSQSDSCLVIKKKNYTKQGISLVLVISLQPMLFSGPSLYLSRSSQKNLKPVIRNKRVKQINSVECSWLPPLLW